MRKAIVLVSYALLIGLVMFVVSLEFARTPWGINGFPLRINHLVNSCPPSTLNPLNGCGFVYDSSDILLDLFFWVAIGLIPSYRIVTTNSNN